MAGKGAWPGLLVRNPSLITAFLLRVRRRYTIACRELSPSGISGTATLCDLFLFSHGVRYMLCVACVTCLGVTCPLHMTRVVRTVIDMSSGACHNCSVWQMLNLSRHMAHAVCSTCHMSAGWNVSLTACSGCMPHVTHVIDPVARGTSCCSGFNVPLDTDVSHVAVHSVLVCLLFGTSECSTLLVVVRLCSSLLQFPQFPVTSRKFAAAIRSLSAQRHEASTCQHTR